MIVTTLSILGWTAWIIGMLLTGMLTNNKLITRIMTEEKRNFLATALLFFSSGVFTALLVAILIVVYGGK
jgi:hypothetical protein